MKNKNANLKKLQIIIFVVFALALSAPNYSQYQFSALAARLMEEFSLNQAQFTAIFSAPMIPAVLCSIICGVLVDKIGFKYVIGFAIILTTIGVFGRLFAQTYIQLYICMILLGTSSAFLTANSTKIISSVYEPHRVGVVFGCAISISTAAMALSTATTAMLATKTAFIISAVVVVIDLVVWFTFIPSKIQTPIQKCQTEQVKIADCLKTVLKNKYIWLIAIGLFCTNGAMTGSSSLLSAALISRGMSETAAGAVSSFPLIGNIIGSLVAPTISAKTGKTRLVMLIFSIITAIGIAFSWLAPEGILLNLALTVTGIGIGSVLTQLIALNVRIPGIGPVYAGTAGGVCATFQLLGAIVIPTHIAAAAAGDNYFIYFGIIGIGMIICSAVTIMLPKSLD